MSVNVLQMNSCNQIEPPLCHHFLPEVTTVGFEWHRLLLPILVETEVITQ